MTKFTKGHPKVGGRKKGTPNQVAARRKIMEAVEENFPLFMDTLLELANTDKARFAQTYLKLMTFVIPTLQSVAAETTSEIKTSIDDLLRSRMETK